MITKGGLYVIDGASEGQGGGLLGWKCSGARLTSADLCLQDLAGQGTLSICRADFRDAREHEWRGWTSNGRLAFMNMMRVGINALHLRWGINAGNRKRTFTEIVRPWYDESPKEGVEFVVFCQFEAALGQGGPPPLLVSPGWAFLQGLFSALFGTSSGYHGWSPATSMSCSSLVT